MRRTVRAVVACSVVSALMPALPAAGGSVPADSVEKPDSVEGAPLHPHAAPPLGVSDPSLGDSVVRSPEAGTAEVSLDKPGLARAGALPVLVGRATGKASPSRVQVRVLDQQAAAAVGAHHIAFEVTRADGGTAAAPVTLAVDYSGIALAFGGDFATRLRLTYVPGCDPSASEAFACPAPSDVPVRNDVAVQQLSAEIPASSDMSSAESAAAGLVPDPSGGTFALTSSASGSAGDYGATPMLKSDKWQVGVSAGGFSYSYEVPLPPAPAGPVPRVVLDYSSQSVDGRTAAENAQPSQVGEGWSFEPGYVERRFGPCAAETSGWPGGDLCWGAEHYLHLNGRTSEIVRPDAGGEWRLRDDPAWRVQNLTDTSPGNGDFNGTYWLVTTPDGTKYYFGSGYEPTTGTATNSVWTVPVFGNNVGEANYNVNPALAYKDYGWRFNLDYVKDVDGNTSSLFWTKETNYYARRGVDASVSSYVRGGYPTRIEYGERAGAEGAQAPSYVNVSYPNRCLAGSVCKDVSDPTVDPDDYPDVPLDLICRSSTSCPDASQETPSFWSSKRLHKIDTWAVGASGAAWVTQIQLAHIFPDPGDTTDASLWLNTITRVGTNGTSGTGDDLALPPVKLYHQMLANRVDTGGGSLPAVMKARLHAIVDEIGAQIDVTYGQPYPCSPIPSGNWDTNAKHCFPQNVEGIWQAFNKYVVTQVQVTDNPGVSPTMTTNYSYLDTPAWHHDDSSNLPAGSQSWSDYRGHARVRVSQPGSGTSTTVTEHLTFRGMHGDKLTSGLTKVVSLTDSESAVFTDSNWFAGYPLEVSHYSSTGSSHIRSELFRYWAQNTILGPMGSQPHNAQYVRPNVSLTKYLDTSPGVTGWYRRRVDTTYDSTYSYATQIYDQGNTAQSGDETCAKTKTTPNATAWLLDVPYQTKSYSGSCPGTDAAPALGQHDVYYDNQALGSTPVKGNPTDTGDWRDGSSAWRSIVETGYDALGRVTSTTNAYHPGASPLGTTTTSYSPSPGHPYTAVTVTNPKGHVTTTIPSVPFGGAARVTDPNGNASAINRDALGRVESVQRPLDGGITVPSIKYEYNVSQVSPSWVHRSVLQSNSGSPLFVHDYTYFDGMGRAVESQSASPYKDGSSYSGRIVTATRYDVQGHVAAETLSQWNASGNGLGLLNPSPTAVHGETRHTYDALGRENATEHWRYNTFHWRTATSHYGLYDETDAPERNNVRRYTDVFGRLSKVSETLDAGGPADTVYTYTPRGDLDTVTDAAGNRWDYGYDWLGRRTQSKDPDQGTWHSAYDAAGNVTSVSDGLLTPGVVAYSYDELHRRTKASIGTPSGTTLATWAYDSATEGLGLLASSTRKVAGNDYTTSTSAYDVRGRPLHKTTTIPAAEAGLAGSYTLDFAYDLADHATSVTYPAAGGLPAETVTSQFNPLGYHTGLTGTDTYLKDTLFTGEARPAQRQLGTTGSVRRNYRYGDVAKRLTTIQTDNNGTVVEDSEYAYDAESNLTSMREVGSRDAAFAITSVVQNECFDYDGLNRLTHAFTNAGTSTCVNPASSTAPDPYELTYGFGNAIGNITSVAVGAGAPVTNTYPPSGSTSVRPHAVSQWGSSAFGYDANGAMTSRPGQSLTWDELHRLKAVTTATSAVRSIHDADGNRLVRTDATIAGGVETWTTKTLYLDGMEVTAANGGSASGVRYYGQVAARKNGTSQLHWVLANHQNSVTVAIKADTGAVTRRRYLPYGGDRTAGTLPTERGFLHKTKDATGLSAVGARFYDTAIGRFTSADPLVAPGDPSSLNPYAYAFNNPTTLADPSGLFPCIGCGISDTFKEKVGGFFSDVGEGLSDVGGIARGVGEGAVDLVVGVGQGAWGLAGLTGARGPGTFTNVWGEVGDFVNGARKRPLETIKNIGYSLVEPIATDWRNGNYGEAIGRGVFEGVAAVVTGGAAKAAAAGGKAGRFGGALGNHVDDVSGVPKADFVASGDGVVVPLSRTRLEGGFNDAGLPSRPTFSPGTEYALPDGTFVRVMERSGDAPLRASFTNRNSGPISPFTGKPIQPPRGLTRPERLEYVRLLTHLELGP